MATLGATNSGTELVNNGYTLSVFTGNNTNPATSTTYYMGGRGNVLNTTNGVGRIYIPKTGTVKAVYGYFRVAGTLGSSETSTVSFRLNDTTDSTITTTATQDAAVAPFSGTGLSIAVTAGDFFELKWVTPSSWSVAPTNVSFGMTVYIE